MFVWWGRHLGLSTLLVLACWAGISAAADDKDLRDLRERMQKLEAQNDDLLRRLDRSPAPAATPLAAPIDEDTETIGESQVDAPCPQPGSWTEAGSNRDMHVVWRDYNPWIETNDGAFRVHVGGVAQVDGIWAHTTDAVQFGAGGIGAFRDAVNFRRGRIEVDGWCYEVFDFWCEYEFFNTAGVDPLGPPDEATNVVNVPTPTDLYGSINYLPFFGTLRAGNMKAPISLEHMTNDRFLDFLERSGIFDAYLNRNQGFQPGVQMVNWTENERLTWALGMFKNNNTVNGWNVSDGDYQFNARVTALPFYRDEGRYLVHLGCGVQYDAPDNGTAILREHWLLQNGPLVVQNTVALAALQGEKQAFIQPELFVNIGPFSMQAEYLANHLDNVTGFTTQPQGTVAAPLNMRTYFSQGAYVQAMYFLTGEHRPYVRTGLHSAGAAPTRVVPQRNFFWLPGHGCPNPLSCGAWQVGARWSYSDLTNHGIFGGQINEVTLGLNWFLNPNARIQWNYDIGYRGQLGPGSTSNGTYQGLGVRLAFDF